mmetsp:Transcript_21247/g.48999  ORF Transcript_21247/g.48999 Transcript_21247/m.48999 type:complete len:84 (+) Transcript_21247:131-382(+)|eukprot:CAMPEP_0116832158 /NCGR_PEP_ID=MMETSP0418-20121206/5739_1 /TAXON_ID=1158023 /ORGANISM="Astrosyne radiata, Strain 13vi08-1A" /LENGTH=83 /DNA_ID=CAMNT_0004461493 /DNA_START=108 /DNA_END=359 /DNA_ORIENTATION=+
MNLEESQPASIVDPRVLKDLSHVGKDRGTKYGINNNRVLARRRDHKKAKTDDRPVANTSMTPTRNQMIATHSVRTVDECSVSW